MQRAAVSNRRDYMTCSLWCTSQHPGPSVLHKLSCRCNLSTTMGPAGATCLGVLTAPLKPLVGARHHLVVAQDPGQPQADLGLAAFQALIEHALAVEDPQTGPLPAYDGNKCLGCAARRLATLMTADCRHLWRQQ